MIPVQPSIDGVGPSAPGSPDTKSADVRHMKQTISLFGIIIYLSYVAWCAMLLVLLPSPTGGMQTLIQFGTISAFAGGAAFLLFGFFGLMRIRSNGSLSAQAKQRGLIRTVVIVLPALVLSAAVPFLIAREPTLSLEIEKPALVDMIAPIAVTFSAEKAMNILQARGEKVLQYKWDIDGDGKVDRETVVPTLTTTYEREGSFTTAVNLTLASGGGRRLARRIIIQQAVFIVDPQQPIINQPATFDASNLVQKPTDIQNITWDFDNDGRPDEEGTSPSASYTFYVKGSYPVTVTVSLKNNTQSTYQRTIEIVDPPPLPFPIEILSTPKTLKGPAPFSAVFSLKTDEPLSQVQWYYGDGTKSDGANQSKAAHTFTKRGKFVVSAKVRSASGTIAFVSTDVQVADLLNLSDLTFKSKPALTGDKVSGEVPLTVELIPQTSVQFVTFQWEAPGATEILSSDSTFRAVYRTPGDYKITMLAENAEGKLYIKSYVVEVKEITSFVSFLMRPEEGVAPLVVEFDASESDIPNETISGFEWDFGDGSEKQFSGAQIEHEYTQPNTYQVTVRARTNSGNNEGSANRKILVRAPSVQACFLTSRTTLGVNKAAQFNSDCTTGIPQSYVWDFGDGSQGAEPNPIHSFAKPGVYNVNLTVTDITGKTSKKTVKITVE